MTTEIAAALEMPAAGTYQVDPHRSTVSYSGRHMFGLGAVHAEFKISSGELRLATPPAASTVVVSIDAASFSSNSAKRDKDVRSATLLDVATFPDITFRAGAAPRAATGGWVLPGTVTAHGSAVPVEVTIDRITPEDAGVRIHARAAHLDRYAFGVTKGKGMVGRYLDLDLDVFAAPV